jgi:hypothetical protein
MRLGIPKEMKNGEYRVGMTLSLKKSSPLP